MVESESLVEILPLFTSLEKLDKFLNFSQPQIFYLMKWKSYLHPLTAFLVNMASPVIGTTQH